MPGSYGNGVTSPTYETRSPPGVEQRQQYFSPTTTSAQTHYPPPPSVPYPQQDNGYTMGDYKDYPPHERPGYVPHQASFPQSPQEDDLAYGDRHSPTASRHSSFAGAYPGQQPGQRGESNTDPAYRYRPQQDTRSNSYTYQYAPPPEKVTYTRQPQGSQQPVQYRQTPQNTHAQVQYSQTPQGQFHDQVPRTYSHNAYAQDAQIVDITPGHEKPDRTNSRSHRLSVSTQQTGGLQPQRSPGLGPRMNRLSVSGDRPDFSSLGGHGGNLPPPSPLLEAYRGTYQSISPMPLAIRSAEDDDDLSDLEPLSPGLGRRGIDPRSSKPHDKLALAAESKRGKRVVVYDAEEDAKRIARCLNHSKPDPSILISILPPLSHDQIWELRKEYKKQIKIQGKGINLPKHLKMKVPGLFGKAVYVIALGRWESEGYWANFWYQAHGSRRELLIESLMGRTNAEIRDIKDEFRDKRYGDSLNKCMEKELKMDKFRTAVLMVLEERRQEEQDVYPLEYRNRDVETLRNALTARQGGESAMLEVVVRRSDAHLREVLRSYEKVYGENFARQALKKSNNLVVSPSANPPVCSPL